MTVISTIICVSVNLLKLDRRTSSCRRIFTISTIRAIFGSPCTCTDLLCELTAYKHRSLPQFTTPIRDTFEFTIFFSARLKWPSNFFLRKQSLLFYFYTWKFSARIHISLNLLTGKMSLRASIFEWTESFYRLKRLQATFMKCDHIDQNNSILISAITFTNSAPSTKNEEKKSNLTFA